MNLDPDARGRVAATASVAWQAAEAAFAAPALPSPQAAQAQITVRKTRLETPAVEPALTEAGRATTEPTSRRPRVFRVQAVQAAESADGTVARAPTPAESTHDDGESTEALARSKRIATDKRPGPVSHVYALPVRTKADAAEPGLDELIAELAKVGPALEAIRRAQSFDLFDQRIADEWSTLSRTVEDLRRELGALRR